MDKKQDRNRMMFNLFYQRMEGFSDEEIVSAFNEEVGKPAYISARFIYLAAIHEQMRKRGIDFSEVGDVQSLSFAQKVKLIGKRLYRVL